ncbi:protein FAM166B [Rhinatrema bivittatum]|uniref:protein FAM166B n=1 Tax=Rhinatrema bivittatum TaxID=194408 RepID=UPI00112A5199|nr:protein FAM166B [Rhinatrema bivittatum]
MTAEFAPKLVSPDPHYIPGYSGFCPQYKYHLGKSYGNLTSQLLTNPDISHSQRPVLQSLRYPVAEKAERAEPPVVLLKSRRRHWGEDIFTGNMIPGYTGFIPRSQHYFAKTYAQIAQDALNDFVREQNKMATQGEELTSLKVLQEREKEPSTEEEQKLLIAKSRTPLPPVSTEAFPNRSPCAFQAHGSPYFMEDNNPHKYFISGFTGYVPRARFLFGAGYPITTNRALVEFGHKTWKKSKGLGAGIKGQSLPDLSKIYPNDLGLLPSYTGYVPGYKFQYGKTYGQLTQNALGLNTLQKEVAASM